MENKKSKKKIMQFTLIGVMLVLIAVAFIMLAVIGNDKEREWTYEDYLMEGDKQLEKGDKAEAYKNYCEAYSKKDVYKDDNTITEKVIYKLFSVAETDGEKLVFAYNFLDLYKDEDADNKIYNEEISKYVSDYNGKDIGNNPVFEGNKVYFGSYPQSKITDEKVVEYLKTDAAIFDKDGYADVHGKKILRLETIDDVVFFNIEKIEWKILLEEDGKCFMVSDKVLDRESFMEDIVDSSWDESFMREWVNDVFAKKAFTEKQYKKLQLMHIANPDNYCYGISNGADCDDYISLLSCVDLTEAKYGFLTKNDMYDDKRIAKCTDYAAAMGVFHDEEMNAKWWTNSNGSMNISYVYVNCNGVISVGGELCTSTDIGVRPVITLKK